MCNNLEDTFGSAWDPFGQHQSSATRHNRRARRIASGKHPLDPEVQAEIDAEMAANERTALVRKRKRSSTLFGAGSRVLGNAASTGATGGGSALGRGGAPGGASGGGGPGGGRGGYGLR